MAKMLLLEVSSSSMCWLCWCLVMFVDLPSCNTLFYSGSIAHIALSCMGPIRKAVILIYVCHGWNCIFGSYFYVALLTK